ncbi:MAG: hypothetical protein LBI41_00545 [Lactobacillales bacterium]|nr:hypothetical protein [Lactobacillales bacterium]
MFSYNNYKEIIQIIKKSGKYSSFHEVKSSSLEEKRREEFILMRHDVEFSVERAFKLAKLENDNDFCSHYFFQLTNNAYNFLSRKNIDMINEMINFGHKVGLHFHLNDLTEIEDIKKQIVKEIQIMSEMLNFKIDSFSIHRPTVGVLRANIKLPGIINAYEDRFFSFTENVKENPPEILYIADSKHRWNYGLEPDKATLMNNKRIQILTHPYSWTPEGYDNLNNFRTLIAEKQDILIETLDAETKHFKEIRDAL